MDELNLRSIFVAKAMMHANISRNSPKAKCHMVGGTGLYIDSVVYNIRFAGAVRMRRSEKSLTVGG
jgi:tRNA A37 N6-isopentenylltransferase MiaA